jgi:hypothetical protein
MKNEINVKWWEWLLFAVALEAIVPTQRGRKVRWEWLILAGVLTRFL